MRDEMEPTKSYEQVRREYVEHEISKWANDGDCSKHSYSEYRRALDAISKGAMDYAVARELPKDDYGPNTFGDVLYDACEVLSDLAFAVRANEGANKEQLRLWSHRHQALNEVRSKKVPQLDRSEIEACVGRYLKLPFRAQEIDRLLVDLLVATELFAYGELMLLAPSIPGFGSTSPLKRRPILEWVANAVLTIVIWLAIAAGLWGLSLVHLIPESWLVGPNVVLGVLAFVSIAWSTLTLPRTWWLVHKGKAKVLSLLDLMNGVYFELSSNGPISGRHIDQQARTASNAGVVWPAPLFALLDDINGRTGRF